MMYNCLIVDDEPLARKVIERHLEMFPRLTLCGSVESTQAAALLMDVCTIDLIFLDIRMPQDDGLQFIQRMKSPPTIIFITAFTEFAVESYELDAVDYLVKPVSYERFERAVYKFLQIAGPLEIAEERQFIFVKEGGKLIKVFWDAISYVESRKDYLMIYTSGSVYIKHMTMKAIEALLPADRFKRVHRGFIVAAHAITGLYHDAIEIQGKVIPIGEKYKKDVLSFFRGGGK